MLRKRNEKMSLDFLDKRVVSLRRCGFEALRALDECPISGDGLAREGSWSFYCWKRKTMVTRNINARLLVLSERLSCMFLKWVKRVYRWPDAMKLYQRCFGRIRGSYLFFRTVVISTTVEANVQWDPFPYPITIRAGTSDVNTFAEVLLDGEYDFALIHAPAVILDAGANIGMASIWYATKYPSARVVAIEPAAGNVSLLLRNCERTSNIEILHGGIWRKTCELGIIDVGNGPWAFQTQEIHQNNQILNGEVIQAYSINDILDIRNLDKVDLLKIDVEGAESEIFGSDCDWLSRVNAIAIELHDRFKSGCSQGFYSAIDPYGFPIREIRGLTTFVSQAS
jgi:FkbM family methyltransferase